MDTSTDKDLALVALDQVMQAGLERAMPVRFQVAANKAERETIYRLRYRTMVARGWVQPGDLPAGLDCDEFDAEAEHVLGYDGEQLAAYGRLVFPRAGRLLPTEAAFGVRIAPEGDVVDFGRIVVTPEYSDIGHRVMLGLMSFCWGLLRSRGFKRFCGSATRPMMRLYGLMGLQMVPLGPAQLLWGEERVPLLFDVLASAQALLARTQRQAKAG